MQNQKLRKENREIEDLEIGTEVFVLKFTKRKGYTVSPVVVNYNDGAMVHCSGYVFHCPGKEVSDEDPIGEKTVITPTEVTELHLFRTKDRAMNWIERRDVM